MPVLQSFLFATRNFVTASVIIWVVVCFAQWNLILVDFWNWSMDGRVALLGWIFTVYMPSMSHSYLNGMEVNRKSNDNLDTIKSKWDRSRL